MRVGVEDIERLGNMLEEVIEEIQEIKKIIEIMENDIKDGSIKKELGI